MKALFQRFALIILLFSAIGTSLAGTHRGYEPKMLETGKFLFQGNCAACHGMNAEGTSEKLA
ncbi:MAG: c-type cytochrome [Arenicellales bacterium]